MSSTAELIHIARDAEKWREHQKRIVLMFGWTTEQWATALEWYQPHSGIAPTKLEDAARIQAAYRERFGRDPTTVASTMFDYIALEQGKTFEPWYSRS
jgi:hypothetical protein